MDHNQQPPEVGIDVAKIQEEWCSALQHYPKTKRVLRDSSGYCCLGVAREIFKLQGTSLTYLDSYMDIGLKSRDGSFWCSLVINKIYDYSSLAELNDQSDDFDIIRQLIEKFPQAVFGPHGPDLYLEYKNGELTSRDMG